MDVSRCNYSELRRVIVLATWRLFLEAVVSRKSTQKGCGGTVRVRTVSKRIILSAFASSRRLAGKRCESYFAEGCLATGEAFIGTVGGGGGGCSGWECLQIFLKNRCRKQWAETVTVTTRNSENDRVVTQDAKKYATADEFPGEMEVREQRKWPALTPENIHSYP
jgi:hypothetical protein